MRRVDISRHPDDKRKLNKAIKELKILIRGANNTALDTYLEGLKAKKQTNYSLWQACRNSHRPQQQKPVTKT